MADTVPAMLEPGEYVIKKSVAKKIGYKNLNKMNRGGKMPKVKYQGYRKGGKVGKPYHGTTRELALRVYQKQMTGRPLKGYEKEYSKSGSYKAFTKTKPYEESGRLIRGHSLSEPAMEKAKRMKAAGYKLPPGLRGGGKVKYEYYQKGGEVDKTKKPKIESTDERRARIQALKYPFGADWPEVSKANEARAQAEMARYLSKLKPHQRKSVTSSEYYKRQYPKLHEKYHGKKKK